MSARGITRAVLLVAGWTLVSCEVTNPEPASVSAPASAPAPMPAETPTVKATPKKVAVKPSPAPPKVEPAKAKGQISEMDIGTLFQLQGENRAFLVDVRPAFFYKLGHIPGAISLPKRSFKTLFPSTKAEIDAAVIAGKVIVLYCTDLDCPDGRNTARLLAKEGYSTSVYKGGWKEWKVSGL